MFQSVFFVERLPFSFIDAFRLSYTEVENLFNRQYLARVIPA